MEEIKRRQLLFTLAEEEKLPGYFVIVRRGFAVRMKADICSLLHCRLPLMKDQGLR